MNCEVPKYNGKCPQKNGIKKNYMEFEILKMKC